MRKFTSLLYGLLTLFLLAIVGLHFYKVQFDLNQTITIFTTLGLTVFNGLTDISTLDLFYFLRAFATFLFLLVSLILSIKLLAAKRIIIGFLHLIYGLVVLAILLAMTFQLDADAQVIFNSESSFLAYIISLPSNQGLSYLALFISYAGFIAGYVFTFLVTLISLQPKGSQKVQSTSFDSIVSNELKKFTVPNQVVSPAITPSPAVMPTQTTTMMQPTPPTPSYVQQMPVTGAEQATIQKELNKEKIRLLIRKELVASFTPLPGQHASIPSMPIAPSSSQIDEHQIAQLVKKQIQETLNQYAQQQQELLANLIQEELVKYDALNREAIETFIQEKLEALAPTSKETVSIFNQSDTSNFVNKTELSSAFASLESQLRLNEDSMKQHIQSVLDAYFSKYEAKAVQAQPSIVEPSEPVTEVIEETPPQETTLEVVVSPEPEPITEVAEQRNLDETTLVASSSDAPISTEPPTHDEKDEQTPTPPIPEPITPVIEVAETPQETQVQSIVDDNPVKAKIRTIIRQKINENLPKETPSPIQNESLTAAGKFDSIVPADSPFTRTGKKKIVRIPFQTRMKYASEEQLANYDEIKNYLLSYRVKSRVSATGDTFRLQKVEYAKLTIAGKGLKLYIALDPNQYDDSTIPVDDVSNKKIYQNMPTALKIKSNLSLKRAKQLIDDLMLQRGLTQKNKYLPLAWSKQFLND
jgi:hypothetical protein